MRKIKIPDFFFTLIIPFFFLLAGCNNDRDNDGVINSKDACPDVRGSVKYNGCPVPPEVRKIHVYLDDSESMGGYYNDSTDYKDIISDLVIKLDKEVKPVDITFIADQLSPFKKNIADFSSIIATTKVSNQKSSELHKIFAKIASCTGTDDVSLFVTDGILSFSDSAIRVNREVNRSDASSTLKNNIYGTFADLKQKGFAASVYAFTSRFFGIYYDYQNQPLKLTGTRRPFYIWVIARRELLARFDARLEDISTFQPKKALDFGLLDTPITSFQILPQLNRKGKWAKAGNEIGNIEIEKGQPVQVSLALNLDRLPPYARNAKYLKNNLKLTTNGCTANMEVKTRNNVDSSLLKNERQVLIFEQSTHIFFITITQMQLTKASIRVNLPLKYDTWYLDWSSMNDKDFNANENKTFALEYLINGVKDAYETKNKNYIEVTLNLNK